MKNALVIAAREFEEKRFVAYSAVAFALLPFLVGVIPMSHGRTPREGIVMLAVLLATGFTLGLSVITGASFVGRDLSDGRMSFYFSRPVGSVSIWFGKLIAGIILLVGCFGVIAGPARLVAGPWSPVLGVTFSQLTGVVLTLAVALFLIAHVIGTFSRSRSQLVAFDFAAAVLCGVAIRYLIVSLAGGQAMLLVKWLSISLAIALAAAIIAGGAWQLERGRTDRRRNHLALSQFLWGSMAVVLVLATAYVAWVVSARLSDLNGQLSATHSPSGPLAIVGGTAKARADYRTAFLINTETGDTTRLDSRAVWTAIYARDGRSVVVPRIEGNVAQLQIYRAGARDPVDTGLSLTAGEFFPSDDGGRIATFTSPRVLSVYEIATKRSLVSARIPGTRFGRAFFLTPDVVRVYNQMDDGLQILELDVRTHRLQQTGAIASATFIQIFLDPTAAHMLVRPARTDNLTLNDARTGMVIRQLSIGSPAGAMRFLRDGRIALVVGPHASPRLDILSSEGAVEKEIPLGPSNWTTFVGDDGDRVVLAVKRDRGDELLAVALNRGLVERREPIREWVRASAGMSDPRPAMEPLRDVLFTDAENHIIRWSPGSGAKKVITGGLASGD